MRCPLSLMYSNVVRIRRSSTIPGTPEYKKRLPNWGALSIIDSYKELLRYSEALSVHLVANNDVDNVHT